MAVEPTVSEECYNLRMSIFENPRRIVSRYNQHEAGEMNVDACIPLEHDDPTLPLFSPSNSPTKTPSIHPVQGVHVPKGLNPGSPLTDRLLYSDSSLLNGLISAKPYLYLNGDMKQIIDHKMFIRFGFEELRLIVEWSSRVPEFNKLDTYNRRTMIMGSYMGIMVLRLAFRSLDVVDAGDKLKFTQNNIMSVKDVVNLGWSETLVIGTLKLTRKLKEYDLDLTEFSIMSSILLTYPDTQGISNKMDAFRLQSKMLGELQSYVVRRSPDGQMRFHLILLLIPFLRQLGSIATESYDDLNQKGIIPLVQIYMNSLAGDHKQITCFSTVNPVQSDV